MNILSRLVRYAAFLLVCAWSTANADTFSDSAGAIRGYDPVAYHIEMKPVLGDPAYTLEYDNATWRFSSQENLQMFQEDPERYAPQYGGYCAYAMSKGHRASTDPQAWTIVNGKLYLNHSLGVRKTWLKRAKHYIAKADANWKRESP